MNSSGRYDLRFSLYLWLWWSPLAVLCGEATAAAHCEEAASREFATSASFPFLPGKIGAFGSRAV